MPPKQVISDAVKAAVAASQAMAAGGAAAGPSAAQPAAKKAKVAIGKDDTLHPLKGVTQPPASASTKLQFSSQIIIKKKPALGSSSGGGGARPAASPGNPSQQFKLERAQIARRELAEMDALERAFREDADVWAGPKNVAFVRRYHRNEGGGAEEGNEEENKGRSPIDNPYVAINGSQSRGWMYGEGHAGIGGRSWVEATSASLGEASSPATAAEEAPSGGAFLVDDVAVVENALRANGLGRSDVAPAAYACLLEQARRYALELLADAQDYAIHARRRAIPSLLPADLYLAAEMRGDAGGAPATLPAPERISELAGAANRAPLPPIPGDCYDGAALPPKEQRLTARTFDVVDGARATQRMVRGGDLPAIPPPVEAGAGKKAGGGGRSPPAKRAGAYGAGRGRQIAVRIKGGASSDGPATKTVASGKSGQAKKPKRKLTEL
ncbi:hypothetical protein ACHAXT_012131 [Thalassiosira profunda]